MAWIESRETSKGIRYYVYWRDSAGIRHCKKAGQIFKTAIKIRDAADDGQVLENVRLANLHISFQDIYTSYLKESKATKTAKTLEYLEFSLKPFLESYRASAGVKLTNKLIEDYKSRLLEKGTVNGVKIRLKALNSCFNFAIRKGWLQTNPCKGVDNLKAREVAKFLSRDEIEKLLSVGCKYNLGLKKAVRIALHTGLRLSEVAKISKTSKKVILDGFIALPGRKQSNPRIVPIHPDIVEDIGDFKKWSKERLGRAFRRAVKRSKIGRVRFHDLRHTFCSNYLQSGGTIADLRLITGHKSLKMLQVYAHFSPSYLKERIAAMRLI